jgi:hypothetical protein
MACADERLARPYHSEFDECPAEVVKARKDIPADAMCDCGDNAGYRLGDGFVCGGCYGEHLAWSSEMQDRYDEMNS